MLDIPKLRAQLAGLERRRRAGGRDVVDHLPGAHDDLANAVVGALVRAAAGLGVWWMQPPNPDEPVAVNVADAPRVRVLERDGANEMEWMARLDRW